FHHGDLLLGARRMVRNGPAPPLRDNQGRPAAWKKSFQICGESARFFRNPMRIRFEECVLDTATRELLRGGKPIHLSPKGFELIELLVRTVHVFGYAFSGTALDSRAEPSPGGCLYRLIGNGREANLQE